MNNFMIIVGVIAVVIGVYFLFNELSQLKANKLDKDKIYNIVEEQIKYHLNIMNNSTGSSGIVSHSTSGYGTKDISIDIGTLNKLLSAIILAHNTLSNYITDDTEVMKTIKEANTIALRASEKLRR